MIPGLDPGTRRFKVAIPDATGNPQLLHNRWGEPYTPSVVFFAPDGKIIIGREAVHAALADPSRAVFNWKRSMGTDKVLYRSEDGTEFRAPDILKMLFGEARETIEAKTRQAVREIVACCPANYSDPQKQEPSMPPSARAWRCFFWCTSPQPLLWGTKYISVVSTLARSTTSDRGRSMPPLWG